MSGGATYEVDWMRPQDPDEVFTCTGLTPEVVARRLLGAVKNFGQVTVVGFRREG